MYQRLCTITGNLQRGHLNLATAGRSVSPTSPSPTWPFSKGTSCSRCLAASGHHSLSAQDSRGAPELRSVPHWCLFSEPLPPMSSEPTVHSSPLPSLVGTGVGHQSPSGSLMCVQHHDWTGARRDPLGGRTGPSPSLRSPKPSNQGHLGKVWDRGSRTSQRKDRSIRRHQCIPDSRQSQASLRTTYRRSISTNFITLQGTGSLGYPRSRLP